ncbi:hypothetical protein SAMN05444682_104401 [Parapedobacter indicus]|uniref:Uncharacterized protein n=1 Tax=Parapedobacter indicus TaxID=1477437 RepID=A0A1I3JD81_9SPHI|nr:hypothetical protein CLV26_104402 [Parapedobacter indicus]SFI58174.1 hypothetical protein SAMN05444682_104401 [Parapedobacter indicus]
MIKNYFDVKTIVNREAVIVESSREIAEKYAIKFIQLAKELNF